MRIALSLILLATLSLSVIAQEQSFDEKFKSLQLNSSPAYVILGIEPENIQRPNSPTDFAANIQSAVVNKQLQPNFALTTSPYYWTKHKPNDKRFNILNYVASENYWENVGKSIKLSFATSPSDTFTFGKLNRGTGFGFGFNIQLAHGRISKTTADNLLTYFHSSRLHSALNQVIDKLEADETADLDFLLDEIMSTGNFDKLEDYQKENLKTLIKRKIGKNSLTKKDLSRIRQIQTKTNTISESTLKKMNEQEFPLTREGFMLELAVANAGIAENSQWSNRQNAKTAIWITPSYRFNANKSANAVDLIDIMAVARITFNSKEVDTTNYIDAGAKLQWIHNRFSISAEGIFRFVSKKPATIEKSYTYRTGVTFNYKVNDFITFTSTIGNNFDGNTIKYDDPKTVFAVGGFNFGFSNFFKSLNTPSPAKTINSPNPTTNSN